MAFNYLGTIPTFSREVLNLIEEVEKDRQHIGALQEIRADDSIIIKGLIDGLSLSEKVCFLLIAYLKDEIEEQELHEALKAWKESKKALVLAETTSP